MSKVIDVILHRNKYYTQRFIVIDKLPILKYQQKTIDGQKILFAKDGIFSSMYYYEVPDKYYQAFAGRKFNIPMIDGTVEKAFGQWWHGQSSDNIISVGINTPDGLSKCNVFCSHEIKRDIAEQIFNNFKNPSNNYNKYAKKHEDYMKNIIVSCWE